MGGIALCQPVVRPKAERLTVGPDREGQDSGAEEYTGNTLAERHIGDECCRYSNWHTLRLRDDVFSILLPTNLITLGESGQCIRYRHFTGPISLKPHLV